MKRSTSDIVRIVVSLLVLAGLVGAVAYHRKRTQAKSEAEEREKKMVTLATEAIARIEVKSPASGKLIFERRPKDASGKFADRYAPLSLEFDSVPEWAVTSPYEALPDYYSMNTLLDNIRELSWTKVIDEKGGKPGDYGLQDPPLTIALHGKGESGAALVIRAGEQNSAHSGLYLQTSREPRIVLGDNSLEYLKNRTAGEWRKKEIFGLKELSKVTRLRIAYGGGKGKTILLERKEGRWTLAQPEELPADTRTVEELLSDLKTLRANEIVSEDAGRDAGTYGFDEPYATFQITFDSPEGLKERELRIGGRIEKDKDIYVRRTDFPQVYAVRHALKDSLSKEFGQLVNKKVFSAEKEKIAEIVLQVSGETTELAEKEGKWFLTKPVSDWADAQRVSDLLSRLEELKGDRYLGRSAPAGIGAAAFVASVTAKERTEEVALYDPKGKEPVGAVGGLYYEFKRATYDDLVQAAKELREKRLLTLRAAEMAAVTLAKGKVKVKFARTPEGKWTLGSLEGIGPAQRAQLRDARAAQRVLDIAEDLRLSSFVEGEAPGEEGPEIFTVEFAPKAGAAHTWLFGKEEGDLRYARSVQRGVVGTVAAKRVEEMERAIQPEAKQKSED